MTHPAGGVGPPAVLAGATTIIAADVIAATLDKAKDAVQHVREGAVARAVIMFGQ